MAARADLRAAFSGDPGAYWRLGSFFGDGTWNRAFGMWGLDWRRRITPIGARGSRIVGSIR
jgi:hypothetical protein